MVAVIPGLSQFQLSKGFKKVFLCEWLSNNFRFYLIRQRRGLVVWSVVCLLTVFCVRPPRWVGQSSSLKRVDVWRRFWKWAACGESFSEDNWVWVTPSPVGATYCKFPPWEGDDDGGWWRMLSDQDPSGCWRFLRRWSQLSASVTPWWLTEPGSEHIPSSGDGIPC